MRQNTLHRVPELGISWSAKTIPSSHRAGCDTYYSSRPGTKSGPATGLVVPHREPGTREGKRAFN